MISSLRMDSMVLDMWDVRLTGLQLHGCDFVPLLYI